MRFRFYLHNVASESGKALSSFTSIKRLKHEKSTFVPKRDDYIINWGHAGDKLDQFNCKILNTPENVRLATNKLSFFKKMAEVGVSIPDFTDKKDFALSWVKEGFEVVARKVLSGHSGEGIVIVSKAEDMVDAPLYTKYIPKKEEYRVHVFDGKIIDVQRKIKRPEITVTNWHVRNLDSGFIFARNDIKPDQKVLDYSLRCIEALGLDFGAVDIIYNQKRKEAYLLEVNTAPGCQGQTLENYANAFLAFVKENT